MNFPYIIHGYSIETKLDRLLYINANNNNYYNNYQNFQLIEILKIRDLTLEVSKIEVFKCYSLSSLLDDVPNTKLF